MGIMMREMRELYEAYSRGEQTALPELEVQYGDYAVWQRRWLEGEELGRQMDYWKEKLKSAPPELELPTDYERRALNTSTGGVGSRLMSERVKQGVERLSREEGATSFMGYMAGFQVLMSRYSRQHDISVGTPIANRNRAEIEGVIGLFINTVVIRVELGGRPGYREVMRRVKESALGAYANQDVPFERVVEQMQPERRLDRTPLFQVMMVYQEEGGGEQEMAGMKMMWIGSGEGVAKFDMTLSVVETEAGVGASIEYNRGLFEEATIERMLEEMEILMEGMVEEPERAFEEIGMMSEGERRQLVYENNRARVRRGTTRGVHRIFEKEASRRADAIALVWKGEEISYGELNRRANQLGRYLRQEGVGPEEVVGICLERSVEMVVGMLGVMKAGGAFLPMEATTPASRLSYMVADAGVRLVITKEGKVEWGEEMEARVIELEREREEISRHRVSNIREGVEGENLAYVIYTSGSTGKPKGVGITHANLLPLMKWSREYFGKGEGKRVMENLSPSFDFGVYEIVSTMMGGGKLIIVGREEVMEVGEMSRKVKEWGIEMIHTTPTMMREMRREGVRLEGVEQMHVGGEQMMREMVEEVYEVVGERCEIYNGYGPTEATVNATIYRIGGKEEVRGERRERIAIGRVSGRTKAYILDDRMEVVARGVKGEMYIGGEGVGRGYLGRAEMTAERFVPDPYSEEEGGRMYRTGDEARYLMDGNIEYIGRIDEQVKVRGYRIELGEIEAVLAGAEGVSEAVVSCREDERGEKQLVAYLVVEDEKIVRDRQLRAYLKERLPEYMVPTAFVMIERIPMTPNGKVDRKMLPAPEGTSIQTGGVYVAPRSGQEETLARIWSEVLGVERVGIHDNFFEIGGHSMLAVLLVSLIEKRFNKRLPVISLFQGPTIEHQVTLLDQYVRPPVSSLLVAIRPDGSKPPFFCVHPNGGLVFSYVTLARYLGADQPFYGLQARGLDGEGEPHSDIESMASCYIEAMQAVQPSGPYLLGGWSMGGLVAYEMARQLQAANEQVALLALLDSWILTAKNGSKPLDDTQLLIEFGLHLGLPFNSIISSMTNLLRLEQEEQLGHIIEQARAASIIPPDIRQDRVRPLFNVFKSHAQAVSRYEPKKFHGRITLLRAADGIQKRQSGDISHDGFEARTDGWASLAAGGIDYFEVPGDHFTMVRHPHVQTLAEILQTCIQRAGAQVNP